jgi:phosphoribosylformimino-5-aminoimidazole carboxamide ribotide isomerase
VEVIPAIDLRAGRVVRLEQGDYSRETVYEAQPAAAAARLAACGPPRIHVVDLDGAREGLARNLPAIAAIVREAGGVPVQVGGGVRSLASVEERFGLGADRVVIGTAALENPELLREATTRFPGRIVLGLDARADRVATHGWLRTGELSVERVLERFADLPLAAIVYTDIGRDGMLRGPNLEASVKLAGSTPIPVIASGGVGSLQDLLALARTRVIAGAIVGRALYSGAVKLDEALREVARC